MKEIKKILVPIDFSEASINGLRYALHFAEKQGASIDLLHVVFQDFGPVTYPVMVAAPVVRTTDAAKKKLAAILKKTIVEATRSKSIKQIPTVKTEVLTGTATASIIEYVADNQIDLVLMGTRERHDLVDKLLGTVSTQLLQSVDCSVLVVPEKFTETTINNIGYATDLSATDPFFIWKIGQLFAPSKAILRVCYIKSDKCKTPELKMKDLQDFFKAQSTDLDIRFYQDKTKSVVEGLDDFVFVYDIDLLVLHPPKRGFFDFLFHKSVSQKMASISSAPIFILKN